MAIAEVTVIPIGTGSTSVSEYVAACQKVLRENQEIKHQLTPMGTILEGELNDILDIVRQLHEVPFENGALRVATTLKIDDRRDKVASMDQKIKSVLDKFK